MEEGIYRIQAVFDFLSLTLKGVKPPSLLKKCGMRSSCDEACRYLTPEKSDS